MRVNKGRIAMAAIAVVAILATVPSLLPTGSKSKPKAPVPFIGSITMTSPSSNAALSKNSRATWTYKAGTSVRSTSRVDFQVSRNGTSWATIAGNVPIRDAQTAWDTKLVNDAVYAARVIVRGTTIASAVDMVYVDNGKPAVTITAPSESQVLVDNANEDDDATEVSFSIALGNTKLEAFAFDALSGIHQVDWWLDRGEEGETQLDVHGARTAYNFKTPDPGFHKLYAIATDRAGNSEISKYVTIFTGPGPSAVGSLPPECPADNPAAGSEADPCTLPTSPPASCPIVNPQDQSTIADPCAQDVPDPASVVPTSCPLPENPDPSTVPNDPCAKKLPDPGSSPSPAPTPPVSVPCKEPTQADPVPHCSINT